MKRKHNASPLAAGRRPTRNPLWLLAFLLAFGAVARLFVTITYINRQCDAGLYATWALGVQDGLFSAYDGHITALDYPPFYLILLKPVGMLLQGMDPNTDMLAYTLALNSVPVLFDLCNILLFYCFAGRVSCRQDAALLCAALWAANPSAIFNCAGWGQTDMIMIFQIILTFWALEKERPILCAIMYAIAVLTKLQALYFAPVILLFFLRRRAWKGLLLFLGTGLPAGAAGLLPFMVGSGRWSLPFDLYLGGYDSYKNVNLHAFNLYGLNPALNMLTDEASLFGGAPNAQGIVTGGFTYGMLGNLLLTASLVLLCCTVFLGKRHCVWVDCLLLSQCLFMLTTRQHERYQVITMAFCLCAWLRLRDFRFFKLFGALSLVTFANQFLYLSYLRNVTVHFEQMQVFFSIVNLLLFLYTLVLCLGYSFGKGEAQRTAAADDPQTAACGCAAQAVESVK